MIYEYLNPKTLLPNPWNTNRLTPEAEIKLEHSLERTGMFKPVIVRKLENGDLEVLGGQHRVDASIRLGWDQIPVVILFDIDDVKAKEISLIDNARYGQDDIGALAKLLEEIGTPQEIASFMPFDMKDMDAILAVSQINYDEIGFNDDIDTPLPEKTKNVKSHTVMRFKVPIEDQTWVEKLIKQVIKKQEYNDSDSMINAGDALVTILRTYLDA